MVDIVIEPLDLADPATAADVLRVQRAAYRVEAELIGFDGIPPLHEPLGGVDRGAAAVEGHP